MKNVLLVLGVNAVAAASTVAAYSVGQQIAIGAFSLGMGFVALVTIFRFRSFRDVIAAGRADREADRATAKA